MSDETIWEDIALWEEHVDDESELVVLDIDEVHLMVEPVEPVEDLQMKDEPVVGPRVSTQNVHTNHVGQTHQKFKLIREEKPANKRKYLGSAKTW